MIAEINGHEKIQWAIHVFPFVSKICSEMIYFSALAAAAPPVGQKR